MLDIRFIREHADLIQHAATAKGIDLSISDLLSVDDQRLAVLRQVEEWRSVRNRGSTKIAQLAGRAPNFEIEGWKESIRRINAELRDLESQLTRLEQRHKALMMLVPNIEVEQVVLCKNSLEVATQVFETITRNAEDILDMLELPYRMVAVCTGDLSQKNYKQVDLETWMPSRDSYGETHSSSMLLDFQARRSNIRYRDEHGELRFCYTLNNTAVATPRILIPLLEHHQREDGSVYIPRALRKYMDGADELRP